jgi:hypothetical protein
MLALDYERAFAGSWSDAGLSADACLLPGKHHYVRFVENARAPLYFKANMNFQRFREAESNQGVTVGVISCVDLPRTLSETQLLPWSTKVIDQADIGSSVLSE